MIDINKIRRTVITGLREYLKIAVIRSNQTGEPPEYPYLSYTITPLTSENNGTYGDYEDGTKRKPCTQTWSVTVQSDDDAEATSYAMMARDWIELCGRTYLSDNGVVVQSVGGITSRDNMLTVEYEYRKGFDFKLWMMNEVSDQVEDVGAIESVEFPNIGVIEAQGVDELIEKLALRLTGR